MAYNDNLKNAIYKWNETHREQYLAQQRKNAFNYYNKNKDTINQKRKEKRDLAKLAKLESLGKIEIN
jgi:uncharacterized protein YllA (UPF0747 family)